MYIEYLKANNVRNLSNVELEPGVHLNVFIGPNASGKTALLEAIYILSRGRSFRTPRMMEVIQHQKNSLLVTANLGQSESPPVRTGIEKHPGKTIIRYDGEVIKKISDQARNLPLILIAPDTHRLITGEPRQRRHWLDWGMFHVKPDYLNLWRDYHKSLRHRNALLKNNILDNKQLSGWELAMSDVAARISVLRKDFIEHIQAVIKKFSINDGTELPEIKYHQGWSEDRDLKDCLSSERNADRKIGFTQSGIHRADLLFLTKGLPVASVFSRGRIKQYVSTLVLAQAEITHTITGLRPITLIDDFAAEIDADARTRLFYLLLEQGTQTFLTTTEHIPELVKIPEVAMFHVEHGKLKKVVK